jgi:hypothetical protein
MEFFLFFGPFPLFFLLFSSSPILSTARDDDQQIIPILIVMFAMALKKHDIDQLFIMLPTIIFTFIYSEKKGKNIDGKLNTL